MATQYDNAVELDKLIHNCEFENQQYVKLIEKETELTEKYKQEIESKKDETTRLQQEISRLDEETKHYHRQFVLNRDNCESQKKTSEVLSAHVTAMTSKLEMTASKRKMDMGEKEVILQRYRDTWKRYEAVYKALPLAQDLEQCKLVERESEQRNKQLVEKRDQLQAQLDAYNSKPAIERCDLQTFIIKLAELYVGMTKKKAEYEKKRAEWKENDARIRQLVELQERREKEADEQRRTDQKQENTMQKLTEMQIGEPNQQKSGTNNNAVTTDQELDSPMISVFSEKDDADDTIQPTDHTPHKQQVETSQHFGVQPQPQSWIANYQNQQQVLKAQASQGQNAVYRNEEPHPTVATDVMPSEPVHRHVNVTTKPNLQTPYVAFSNTSSTYSEPSVSIHLQASLPSSHQPPITSSITTSANPLQIHQPYQASLPSSSTNATKTASKFHVAPVQLNCATQMRQVSPLQIKRPPTIPQLVINNNNNNNSNIFSANLTSQASLNQRTLVTRVNTPVQVNTQGPCLINQQIQASMPPMVQKSQAQPMQNTHGVPSLFLPNRVRTSTAGIGQFGIHIPMVGSTRGHSQAHPLGQAPNLTIPGPSFPQAKQQRTSFPPPPNVQVQRQGPIPRPQIQAGVTQQDYLPSTHSVPQVQGIIQASASGSKIPLKTPPTAQEPARMSTPPLKRPHPSPIPDQRSGPPSGISPGMSITHASNVSPIVASMQNQVSSATQTNIRPQHPVSSPMVSEITSPTNVKPKTPEHQKTVRADSASPFSLEKHQEKLRTINKSPGEPIYSNRRMFANQAMSSPVVTAARMFGGAMNSPVVTAAAMFGGGNVQSSSPQGQFAAAPQQRDVPMEMYSGGQTANPAAVTMYGDGHHISTQKSGRETKLMNVGGNKPAEPSMGLFGPAPTAPAGRFPFGGGSQPASSPAQVTSQRMASPMNFFSNVSSPEAADGGMFNFGGDKGTPATNNLLSLFGDDDGDQQEDSGFSFNFGSGNDDPTSPQGGFSMF